MIPAVVGVVAGVLVGLSGSAYWVIAGLAGVGAIAAGLEHQDGWGGADRGLVGGAIYGTALLVTHAIAGNSAKVSLGSFPPFLIVVTAIAGMLLGAIGGRIARTQFRRHTAEHDEQDEEDEEQEPPGEPLARVDDGAGAGRQGVAGEGAGREL